MRSTTRQRLGRRSAGLVTLGILSLCLLMVGADAASVITAQDGDETTTTTEPPTTSTTTETTTTTTPSTTTTTPSTTSTTTSPTTTQPTTTTRPTTTSSSTTTTTTGGGSTPPTTTTTDPSTTSTSTTSAPTTTAGSGPTTTSGSGGSGAGSTTQPTAPPPITVTEITLVPADDPDEDTDEDDAAEELGEESTEASEPAPSAGTFHVSPSAGPPGTEVTFSVRFDLPSAGPETVEIRFGNQRLGDEVAIDSSDVTVRRSVPAVEPGTYDLALAVGELVMARTSFDVMAASPSESSIPLLLWLALPLAAVMLWVAWLIAQARNPTAPNDTYREALAKRTGRDIAVRGRPVNPP